MSSYRVTQRELRGYITAGQAHDARKLDHATLTDIAMHSRRVCHAEGIYGCNGVMVEDRRTGEYYCVPDRSTAMFVLS